MSRYIAVIVALLCLCFSVSVTPSYAVEPDEILKDEKLEARARKLSLELRCVVCQNQSIDDSNAPLAKDLRVLVRERLTAGDTDKQVIDYIVSRYGEFVLLRPRFAPHTLLLWLSPLFFILIGLFLIWRFFSTHSIRKDQTVKGLTSEEEKKLEELMKDTA